MMVFTLKIPFIILEPLILVNTNKQNPNFTHHQ